MVEPVCAGGIKIGIDLVERGMSHGTRVPDKRAGGRSHIQFKMLVTVDSDAQRCWSTEQGSH